MSHLSNLLVRNFSTRKVYSSKLNQKWLRYLKRNKLYDEYLVYSNCTFEGSFPLIDNYESLLMMCHKLNTRSVGTSRLLSVSVNWIKIFGGFLKEDLPWWDFLNKHKYGTFIKNANSKKSSNH